MCVYNLRGTRLLLSHSFFPCHILDIVRPSRPTYCMQAKQEGRRHLRQPLHKRPRPRLFSKSNTRHKLSNGYNILGNQPSPPVHKHPSSSVLLAISVGSASHTHGLP